MIKIDHATFTYGENNEYSVGIRDIDLEIDCLLYTSDAADE